MKRLAVLGAGRLYDLDLTAILNTVETVHLFDLDTTCVTKWRRAAGSLFGGRVVPHLEDLSGCMEAWQRGIGKAYRSGELEGYLCELAAPKALWEEGDFDGVISLNLLGQIPLYWRDRVLSVAGELSERERRALEHSMGVLQQAHLRALFDTSSRDTFLITDTEYYYYQSSQSEWRVEPALWGGAAETFQKVVREGSRISRESWMWHLVPQFIEARHEGEIHRVEAAFLAGM
jgi:hypothetical protein